MTAGSVALLGAAAAIMSFGSLFKLHALLRAVSYRPRVPDAPTPDAAATRFSFALLVPAHDEPDVLGVALRGLALVDHPEVEIVAVVDPADDGGTLAAARQAASLHPGRVSVFLEPPGTHRKPAALNAAVAGRTQDMIGVFDADGLVSPDLLRVVEDLFARHDLDALQTGNQAVAAKPNWYQLHNIAEYRWMFLSTATRRPDSHRVVRLSGNSVFLRAETLRKIGGWRPDQLAEDCDLSLRLALARARTMTWYEDSLVTIEQVPPGPASFVRQRTRWNQGFIQVLRGSEWVSLPWRQRLGFLRVLLEAPARALALPALLLGVGLAGSSLANLLIVAPPTALGILNTGLLTVILSRLPERFGVRVRFREHLKLWVFAPAFQGLLSLAAVRALWRTARGDTAWEKTAHTTVLPASAAFSQSRQETPAPRYDGGGRSR